MRLPRPGFEPRACRSGSRARRVVAGAVAVVAFSSSPAAGAEEPVADVRDESLLDASGPVGEPGLSHGGTAISFEYTVASAEPTDVTSLEPTEGGRAYAYVAHLAFETPFVARVGYLGASWAVAAASVPAGVTPGSGGHALVAASPDLWVRGLWSNGLGLSAGGGFAVVLPLPRAFDGVEIEVVRAVRVVRPWDDTSFQDRTLAIEPWFDVRHVVGPLTVQLRQGLDVAVVVRDLVAAEHRTELLGRGGLFASLRVVEPVSVGLDLSETYALTADASSPSCLAPCDRRRFGFTLSPVVRLHAPPLSPALSALIPLLTPLRGEAASFFAVRLDLEALLDFGLDEIVD